MPEVLVRKLTRSMAGIGGTAGRVPVTTMAAQLFTICAICKEYLQQRNELIHTEARLLDDVMQRAAWNVLASVH